MLAVLTTIYFGKLFYSSLRYGTKKGIEILIFNKSYMYQNQIACMRRNQTFYFVLAPAAFITNFHINYRNYFKYANFILKLALSTREKDFYVDCGSGCDNVLFWN